MLDFSVIQWTVVISAALMIGFSKTGVPGTGILIPPLMASVMPAKASTGFVLPMLAMADIMAIVYWRRHVEWRHLFRLLPWTWLGVIMGFLLMGQITDDQLKRFIGVLVLGLLGLAWFRVTNVNNDHIPHHWLFAAFIGLLAGSTSMLANAAGPVMIIYLVAMRLPKNEFIGTRAWFFWILNLSKMPFSANLDLMNASSLLTNLALVPCLVIGGLLGIALVNVIPQRAFDRIVKLLALAAALYLCLPI